ncbi:type I restriction endonuclease subunit R [Georgenia muralis]|uniref:Type I restriction enzyme endonuclease subunit n=1 Tax=Georgenia muralis TaxID=154117 RepID=A0A3N4Z8U2_9MICO|nr:HsdR family type I site-specific deoxyribonuclease [Georgenia muralis]RPF28563.1 type I restriction enzyme R subunit [Georgenia muralis]
MSTGFTEASTIQKALVKWAVEGGWTQVPGDELPRHTTDVLITDWVVDALVRLNPDLDRAGDNVSIIVAELRAAVISAGSDGLLAANELMTTILRGNRTFKDVATSKSVPRRFIDFDDPASNQYVVADEVTLGSRRFDVVFYVNGFPLVVIETKTPVGKKITWLNAAKDLVDVYQDDYPSFFATNLFQVATDGHDLRYGAVAEPAQAWSRWGDMDGDPALIGPQRVERDARLLLDPFMVLRILRSYTLFAHSGVAGSRKLLPRYPQVQAAEAIHDKVLTGRPGGLIWHYQGSGKTFLSLFAALRLLNDPHAGDPTVIMLVDRTQLASQAKETFLTGGMPRLEAPQRSEELHDLLRGDYRGIIVTTIHKFAEAGFLNARDNIVVLVDEAHRTQEGNLGTQLRAAVPNARFFGMTGTPIADTDRNTFKLFGDPGDPGFVMSTYEPERSIADGTTVPVYVESRRVGFDLDQDALDAADEELAEQEGLTEDQHAYIASKVARKKVFFSNPDRVAAVCVDIVDHYRAKFAPLGLKAQVVALDREMVVAYKDGLERVITDRGLPYTVELNMTVTGGKDDPYAKYELDEAAEEKQKKRFTDPDDPLTFLVVTAKLMTGFDAPNEGVIYLDKPLTRHTLFQAITRPNRKYTSPDGAVKDYGLVVDYLGMDKAIDNALRTPDLDTPGQKRTVGVNELAGRFVVQIATTMTRFAGIDPDDDSFEALTAALQAIGVGDARDDFAAKFLKLQGMWEFLDPHPILAKYAAEYRWLAKVYDAARPHDAAHELLWARVGPKTIALVHQHMENITVTHRGGRAIIEPAALIALRDLTDDGTVEPPTDGGEDKPAEEMTVEEVLDSIEARIQRRLTTSAHKGVYESLAKRLELLRQQMLAQPDDAVGYLMKAFDVAKLTVRAERMEDEGTLAGNEALFDPNIGALSQIVAENKPAGVDVVVEKLAAEIDAIVKLVAFTGWTEKDEGAKKVKSELRVLLKRYGLPIKGEPFDSAYAYIRENY